jgi:hypothetical protein
LFPLTGEPSSGSTAFFQIAPAVPRLLKRMIPNSLLDDSLSIVFEPLLVPFGIDHMKFHPLYPDILAFLTYFQVHNSFDVLFLEGFHTILWMSILKRP